MPEETISAPRGKAAFSPREVIFKYIRYVPWLAISVAIMLVLAYIKLRYSTPIYSVSGRLLVTSQTPGGGGEKFDDIFMMQKGDKIYDEIEILKSRALATRVVRSLGLQKWVYNKGKIRSTVIHPKEVPFNFEIISLADSTQQFGLTLNLLNDREFTLNEQPKKYTIGETVTFPNLSFRITHNDFNWRSYGNEFVISWQPAESIGVGLSGGLGVSRVNDNTNVLNLAYTTENVRLGVDIINQYMKEYQQSRLEDKREIAAKTIDFIDDQLKTVFQELGGVENSLQNFRQKNRVFNPEVQSDLVFKEYSETSKELAEHGISMKIAEYLSTYLSDEKNRFKIIPSVLGIAEPTLVAQVAEFNKLQLQRETALKNIAPNNPLIVQMETTIERLRLDMLETLRNVKETHKLTMEELGRKNREANGMISAIPSKEKQMREVTRQQSILQELYSYLLQKKLETAIASASTISNIKVMEPAMGGGPVSPNSKSIYMFAIIIGLAVPVGIVFIIEYFNDKVKSKSEIQQLTQAPILGEIGHADEDRTLVVTKNNRKLLAEQFRIVRSNLQYILPKTDKPVLQVTSSFSGEGKSFISTNLGAVLAISGKRTVILEFDIRKPKIMKGLGLNERKGLTNYIIGSIELNEVIHQVPDVDNLFVIPCGPVPPNPGEMLLQEKVDQLFRELRSQFDAIIIDTAPVGLVSDAITLGRFADATIYIVRHNYTMKKQIQLIEDIYQQKKLPHLSVIINDISSRGGYGGYYGYGYAYGYGYGNGYFENGEAKKGWRKWIAGFKKARN